MNHLAFKTIRENLDRDKIRYALISHEPCRTSVESWETRAAAGYPEAVGAKALVVRMSMKTKDIEFNIFVLPGSCRLSSAKIKLLFPEMKKFRFATIDELDELLGLPPGAVPPFGTQIFPHIARLFIDVSIIESPLLGFNVASLENSIVMKSSDYLRIAKFDSILNFVEENL